MQVNRAQMAEILAVSPPTLDKMVKEGCPFVERPSGRGTTWTYETADVVKWMVEQGQSGGGSETDRRMAAANLQEAEAKAQLRQIELGEKQKALVRVSDVASIIEEGYAIVKSRLQAIPGRMAQPLSVETNATVILRLLKDEVAEALEEISSVDTVGQEAIDLG